MSRSALGYIVLTKQPDGSWRDDWDGVLHVEAHKGVVEFDRAQKALGEGFVRLGRVEDFFEVGAKPFTRRDRSKAKR